MLRPFFTFYPGQVRSSTPPDWRLSPSPALGANGQLGKSSLRVRLSTEAEVVVLVKNQFRGGIDETPLQQVATDDLAILPGNAKMNMLMIRGEGSHHGHDLDRFIQQQRLRCSRQANMKMGQTPDTGGDTACLNPLLCHQPLKGSFQVIALG